MKRRFRLVSLLAAEAEIGAGLGEMDLAEEIAVRRIAAQAKFIGIAAAQSEPDIALDIGAHAVGTSHRAERRDEDFIVEELVADDVEDADIGIAADGALHAGVDDVELLLIGREGDGCRML
jgi:hypothetical protein